MCQWKSIAASCVIAGFAATGWTADLDSGKQGSVARPQLLSIERDTASGRIVISWKGRFDVQVSTRLDGRFRTLLRGKQTDGVNHVAFTPSSPCMIFRAVKKDPGLRDKSGAYSMNIVGYVNLELPPGLSLIANPLYHTNNTVAFWWPDAPDGSQVLRYVDGQGYEVSTFDGIRKVWSNPNLQVALGSGFFFRNPSSQTISQTFVGEVLQGELVNPLPAGHSMKGAMVPQAGSINTIHLLPGSPGEEIRIYSNHGPDSGDYEVARFDETARSWVPDLQLQVGQGFWITKQHAEDWVRYFSVF
jgi:hypothetical protein